jgi:hypothetical protein
MDQFILFCLHDPRLESFFFVMMKKKIKESESLIICLFISNQVTILFISLEFLN